MSTSGNKRTFSEFSVPVCPGCTACPNFSLDDARIGFSLGVLVEPPTTRESICLPPSPPGPPTPPVPGPPTPPVPGPPGPPSEPKPCYVTIPMEYSFVVPGTQPPVNLEERTDVFTPGDSDPIIRDHAVHWLVCVETYEKDRQLFIGYNNWTLVYEDVETCIYRQVYPVGCKVIIGFRGTKATKDLYDDLLLSFDLMFPRATQAIKFTTKLLELNPGLTVELTGHSLGGAIARVTGESLNLKSITFNAAAPPTTAVINPPGTVNYHIVYDLISAWQSPNTIRIDKGFRPVPSTALFMVPYIWVWYALTEIIESHSLKYFSKIRAGTVTNAAFENGQMTAWFSSLPFNCKLYILYLLMGASGNVLLWLPQVLD